MTGVRGMFLGKKHPRAKLTDEDVSQIKALLREREYHRSQWQNLTFEAIAEKFGVHEGHVRRIARGDNWGHVA